MLYYYLIYFEKAFFIYVEQYFLIYVGQFKSEFDTFVSKIT